MQLDSGMARPSQTAAAQTACRHSNVASILLHNYVPGNFGSSKQRMLRLVNSEILSDAVRIRRIGIVPPGRQLLKRNSIGCITVHFVGGEMEQGSFRAISPHAFKQV